MNDKIDVVYLHLPGVVIRPRVGLELSKRKKASKRPPEEDTLRVHGENPAPLRRMAHPWYVYYERGARISVLSNAHS